MRTFQFVSALFVAACCAPATASIGLKVINVQWDARTPLQTSAKTDNLGLDALGIVLGNHGAWGQVMDDKTGLCSALRTQFTKANGVSKGVNAYPDNSWSCHIGEMTNLQIAQGGKNEALLSFNVPGNRLEAQFTQPSVGSWADPRLVFNWDMTLTLIVRMVAAPNAPATLKVVDAKAQLKSTGIDSNNFAGDIAVYWAGIDTAIAARINKDPIVFTGLADAQLAAQMKSIVPPGKEVAGLWAQGGYALVALNPQPLPPGAYENCCEGKVSGRVHWPKSLGAPASCSVIGIERSVFVAPPTLVQAEPPQFSGGPRVAKAFSTVVFTTPAPVDAGNEYHCDYSFGAGSHMAVDVSGGRFAVAGKGQQITMIDLTLEAPQSLVQMGASNVNFVGQGMTASARPPQGMEPAPYDPQGIRRREIAAVLPSNTGGSRQAPAVPTPAAGQTPNWNGAAAPNSAIGAAATASGSIPWGTSALGAAQGMPVLQAPPPVADKPREAAAVQKVMPGQAVAVQKVASADAVAVQKIAPPSAVMAPAAQIAATAPAMPMSARSSGQVPPAVVAAATPSATSRTTTLLSACLSDPRPRIASIEGQHGQVDMHWGQRLRISGCGFGVSGRAAVSRGVATSPTAYCSGALPGDKWMQCNFAVLIVESWSDDAIVVRLPDATGGDLYRATLDKIAVRVQGVNASASLLSSFDNRIVGVSQ
jgi:hypothetical protein